MTPSPQSTESNTTRRGVLRGVAAGAAGLALVPGLASAHHGVAHGPKWSDSHVEWGGSDEMGGETVRTFARVMPAGVPVTAGVRIPGALVRALDDDPEAAGEMPMAHADLPESLSETTPLTVAGVDWNPAGHPGPMYEVPHFDVHFYLLDPETVEAIEGGVADYDIPDDRLPEGYARMPNADGEYEIVPAMGEHLADPTAPEFTGEPFTHTLIWGAYDTDGDGEGELTFVEPMLTGAFLADLTGGVVGDVAQPETYPAAGYYPTKYGIRYSRRQDAYVVCLFGFQRVGADETY